MAIILNISAAEGAKQLEIDMRKARHYVEDCASALEAYGSIVSRVPDIIICHAVLQGDDVGEECVEYLRKHGWPKPKPMIFLGPEPRLEYNLDFAGLEVLFRQMPPATNQDVIRAVAEVLARK